MGAKGDQGEAGFGAGAEEARGPSHPHPEHPYWGSTDSRSCGDSEYVFLGRLVATLPKDSSGDTSSLSHPPAASVASASSHTTSPSAPHAVVECNFWQLSSALAAARGYDGVTMRRGAQLSEG